ncbi:AraC family transcriptional regulator [Oceanicoccus sp. KOV_DT_Chl]|uniref:helix-turn-helix domain-containing protein n=1 Tax=Oceanicoccus sp. KOV_DT_Chl TaxID=1904639 RepID=UPI001358020E|nr:helix-turn-helix domain-containing protein [Oceanicoccus sp. KOV_DT_Chl]
MLLSLLLGNYLLSTKRNYALTCYFFCLAIHTAIRLTGDLSDLPILYSSSNTLRFIYAPLVYLAIKELLYQDFSYHWKSFLHALPFVISLSADLLPKMPDFNTSVLVGPISIIYLIASYRLLLQFNDDVANTRSSGSPRGVRWLQRVLHIYSLLIVFELIRFLTGYMGIDNYSTNLFSHAVFIVALSIFLSLLVYQSMRSPTLLPAIDGEEKAITLAARTFNHSSPQASSQQQKQLELQLNNYMAEHKPFLNPQLTVKELAANMGVASRSLSEVINHYYQCNFSEFINKARVEEAKLLIADKSQQDTPLLDIGLAAGFNSKTSFNVMFKRFTGQTPSSHRQQLSD